MTYPDYIRVPVPMRVPARAVSRPVPTVSPMEHLMIPIRRETRKCAIAHSRLIACDDPSGMMAEFIVDMHFAIEERLYGHQSPTLVDRRVSHISVCDRPADHLKYWLKSVLTKSGLWFGWIADKLEPRYRHIEVEVHEYWEKHYHGIIPVTGE